MSGDEPTTAAEMELLATVEVVIDDAEERALQEDLLALCLRWEDIGDRVERGELTDEERRALREHLHEQLPKAELLAEQARRQVEQGRRRARGDQ